MLAWRCLRSRVERLHSTLMLPANNKQQIQHSSKLTTGMKMKFVEKKKIGNSEHFSVCIFRLCFAPSTSPSKMSHNSSSTACPMFILFEIHERDSSWVKDCGDTKRKDWKVKLCVYFRWSRGTNDNVTGSRRWNVTKKKKTLWLNSPILSRHRDAVTHVAAEKKKSSYRKQEGNWCTFCVVSSHLSVSHLWLSSDRQWRQWRK